MAVDPVQAQAKALSASSKTPAATERVMANFFSAAAEGVGNASPMARICACECGAKQVRFRSEFLAPAVTVALNLQGVVL